MQSHLMRSRNEVMIEGVCGGLAEYFHIDPVIVRLIFVLVTLTSGVGLLVYPVLWLVMPKSGAPARSDPAMLPYNAEEWRQRAHAFGEEAAQVGQQFRQEIRGALRRDGSAARPVAPPPPPYNFDPFTGEPIRRNSTTGQTVNLYSDPSPVALEVPQQQNMNWPAPADTRVTPKRRLSWLGLIVLGLGVLFLLDYMGIDTRIVFPLVMVGAGLLMILRR